MILVGTSGYSYQDWVGPFYPEGTKKADFLAFYSRFFPSCELNYTYYTLPYPKTTEALLKKSQGKVTFCAKAHSSMTHEIVDGERGKEIFGRYMEGIRPLVEAGVFGCILAQFPWSFRPSREAEDHIKSFREMAEGTPVVIELRNNLWVKGAMMDRTLSLLRDLGLGLCCVDEPDLKGLMPRLAIATSDTGYVRFHGRNRDRWWVAENSWERYDYLYSEDELKGWLQGIRDIEGRTSVTYVFFNNHFQSQAVRNARMLNLLLSEGGR